MKTNFAKEYQIPKKGFEQFLSRKPYDYTFCNKPGYPSPIESYIKNRYPNKEMMIMLGLIHIDDEVQKLPEWANNYLTLLSEKTQKKDVITVADAYFVFKTMVK